MDVIEITGGFKLEGEVEVSGAKNAALPVLFAALLGSTGQSEIARVPALQDIDSTFKLLKHLGVTVSPLTDGRVVLDATRVRTHEAPYDLVRKMRASVVCLGPLLARFGEAKVSLPGGCAIGARPINYHLAGLEKLGAEVRIEAGYVHARVSGSGTDRRLRGARVAFDFPSVGATENLMMAATLAQGETVLENCAREPEITDLAAMLRSMGAEIEGDGTPTIRIQGKTQLRGGKHVVMADRIEAGTLLAAGLITGGAVTVTGIDPVVIESVLEKFEAAGASVSRDKLSVRVSAPASGKMGGGLKAVDVNTLPFPGFPTDMQAQFMALMTLATGSAVITETIFENRFMHVAELLRLGADIRTRGNIAVVSGVRVLIGAPLMATDLRASASLVLAGLAAQGVTRVQRVYHLDRGYERLEAKLTSLGARIERKPA